MMGDRKREYIAGWKTADDWRAAKSSLVIGGEPSKWREVFEQFFCTRLELRYLHPISLLQTHGTFTGEGFSIAALQCSLIEFLESTIQGVAYRYVSDSRTLGPYEYSSSSSIFESFLTKREPFSKEFNGPLARDFYSGVRCGLLHEARTKNGWRVLARDSRGRIVDPVLKVLFRDGFQDGLLSFVKAYGAVIQTSPDCQRAFLRKFDDLANDG
jgi:hypothetical protein